MVEVRIEFPFNSKFSKNYKHKCGRRGRGKKFNEMRAWYVITIRAYAKELEGYKRLKLQLNVYRPNKKHDAQNYTEDFCDMVQDAIGINDRYYTVSSQAIDGENPRFELILKGYYANNKN